jgi:hypothetical protein
MFQVRLLLVFVLVALALVVTLAVAVEGSPFVSVDHEARGARVLSTPGQAAKRLGINQPGLG